MSDKAGAHNLLDVGHTLENRVDSLLQQYVHAVADCLDLDIFRRGVSGDEVF